VPLTGTEGQPVSGVVALINDPDPSAKIDQFQARIGLGGAAIQGVIAQPGGPGTPFQVSASRTFTEEGSSPVTVTVFDAASNMFVSTRGFAKQGAQDETSATLAVDPTGPKHLFAASQTSAGPGLAAVVSVDGGQTWTPFDAKDGLIADGDDALPTAFGFPRAAFDANGNLYLTYGAQDQISFVLAELPAGGTAFQVLAQPTVTGAPPGQVPIGPPALAVGPGGGTPAGAVWFADKNKLADVIKVAFRGGPGPQQIPGSQGSRSRLALAVGPDGQVLVAFQAPAASPGVDDIFTSLDADGTGPNGFAAPIAVPGGTALAGFLQIPAQENITANLGLAYDRTQGPHHGRVYLVYTDIPSGGGTAVYLRYSDDNGSNWSDPVSVSRNPAGTYAFLPSLAVDQTTGDVGVTWYDTSADPAGKKAEFLAAVSGDGGKTFSIPLALSLGASDATVAGLSDYARANQYGDSTGLDFAAGILYTLWADDSQSLGSGATPHFDLAAARVGEARIADASLSVKAQNLQAVKGQNFNGPVGSFTDPDPNDGPKLYTAIINWGDNSTSVGTVQGSGGTFTVSGQHQFTDDKVFPITLAVRDQGGSMAQATAKATVVDPPPVPSDVQPSLTAFVRMVTGQVVVGQFTVAPDQDPESNPLSARIDWGDGTPAVDGTVGFATGASGGQIVTVSGSHTYGREGTYHPTVTLTVDGNSPGSASSTVKVLKEVSESLKYTGSGLIYNPQTQLFNGTISLTNTSSTPITGPEPVVLDRLPSGVTLADASGTTGTGAPYITDPAPTIAPGQTSQVPVQFSNPGQMPFNYTVQVFDPPPPTPPDPLQLVSVTDPDLISASANGPSVEPSMSADGRFVVFASQAPNLIDNEVLTPGQPSAVQIYLRDRQSGTTTLVSLDQTGKGIANQGADTPIISPDGRYVAFMSRSTNLVSQSITHDEWFVRDLQTGTTSLLSGDATGTTGGNGLDPSPRLVLSGNGRYALFESNSTNLVTNDAMGGNQLFVRDLQKGTTTLVSVDMAGTDGGGAPTPGYSNTSYDATVSDDGRYVAFQSASTNLVANDAIGGEQVFVRDMQLGVTRLVSVNSDGTDGGDDFKPFFSPDTFNAGVERPRISGDGRVVVFQSVSTNLLPQKTTAGVQHLFVRDLQKGTTGLVDIDPGGAVIPAGIFDGFPDGFEPAVSADGTHVAFTIQEPDVISELFVRDLTAGTTTLASINLAGTGNTSGFVDKPALSSDGRYVTFLGGRASDLVANDPISSAANVKNPLGGVQLFQRDLQMGVTTLVSANQTNTDGADNTHTEGQSGPPPVDFEPFTVSADGRFVCFATNGDNLVANDYNEAPDVFVRDVRANTTDLVSVRAPDLPDLFGPSEASPISVGGSVSADGRYVAFASERPDLLPPFRSELKFGQGFHAFVRDLQTGNVTLVDVNGAGTGPAAGDATVPVISPDGRFVLFLSDAGDLDPKFTIDPNQPHAPQLYLRDLQQGSTRLVTVNQAGTAPSTDLAEQYSMSADGRFVVFESNATDLAAIPRGAPDQIFVRDMQAGVTSLVSVNQAGTSGGNSGTTSPEISADGRFVLFTDGATDLVPGVTSGQENVYVRDLQKGTTALVSINRAGTGEGTPAFAFAGYHTLSNDGRFVTFVSGAADLVGPDQQPASRANVFVRDLQTGATSLVSVSADGKSGAFEMINPTISGNGRFVAFESEAPNLVPGITTSGINVFVRDLQAGTTVLASVNVNGGGTEVSDDTDSPPLLSDDGRFVILTAQAKDLVPGDTAGTGAQLFLRDLQKGTTVLVSRNLSGTGGSNIAIEGGSNGPLSNTPAISGDGSTIVFVSRAGDLLAHDFNANTSGNANVYAFSNVTPPPDAPLTAIGTGVQAVEGAAFRGVVATFTDADPNGQLGDYSATIDWGDGTTTAGAVTADPVIAGQFDVSGGRTYAEEGAFGIVVTITDSGGSTATALTTVRKEPASGAITYHVVVDTSSLRGTSGSLALQFNPGAIPDAQGATATVDHFQSTGATLAGTARDQGGSSGSLADAVRLANRAALNAMTQGITFGTDLSFDVTLSGTALAQPGGGRFGSTFALQLFGADGTTPRLTTDASGAAVAADVSPGGSGTARYFAAATGGKPAALVRNVEDAPLAAQGTTLSATLGTPLEGVVAAFTDSGPAAPPGGYKATITWGDGTSSPGTIQPSASAPGTFTVTGTHTFAGAGSLQVRISILDPGGAAISTATTVRVPAPPPSPTPPSPRGSSPAPPTTEPTALPPLTALEDTSPVLTLSGANFTPASVVLLHIRGRRRVLVLRLPTTFVNHTMLRARVPLLVPMALDGSHFTLEEDRATSVSVFTPGVGEGPAQSLRVLEQALPREAGSPREQAVVDFLEHRLHREVTLADVVPPALRKALVDRVFQTFHLGE
jgi:Tol biopolymer transport system component